MAGNPVRVNQAWIRQFCGGAVEHLQPSQAYEVAARLKNLAVWWLRPEVLQMAADHARQIALSAAAWQWQRCPQLPAGPGACWIGLVNRYPDELGLLRPAYAMPLRWARRPDHDARLPAGLAALADQVRSELNHRGEVSIPWGLEPAADPLLSGLDLNMLEGQWDSAWAPLAAGLLVAAWEGTPDPTLWASGAWFTGQGFQTVDGLEAKLELAHSFHARIFFVPEPQAEPLRAWAKHQHLPVEVRTLPCRIADPRQALAEYLQHHQMPVGPGPHLNAKRTAHFLRIDDEPIATQFYSRYVMPDVVEQLRHRIPAHLTQGTKKLLTIVSQGFHLSRLAVQVIRPAACLLLHDGQLAETAQEQKALIEQEAPDCRADTRLVEAATRQQWLAAFQQAIEQYAGCHRPEELVFDLTAGKRIMNLALYDAAPPGSYLVCIQAEFSERRRPIPYTEQIDVWRSPL